MTQRGQAGAGWAISATAIPEVISCHAITAQGCKGRSHPSGSWPGWAPWGSGPARREKVQNPREGGGWSHRLRVENRDGSQPGDGVGSSDPARTWPAHGQCTAQSRWAVENGEHTGSSSPLKARHRRKLGPVVPCASGRGGPAPAKDLGNGILSEGEFPQEASASSHSNMAGNNPSKGSVSAASKRYCLGKGSLFPRIIHPAGKNQPDFCLLKNTGHQERGHHGSTWPPTPRGCSRASRCSPARSPRQSPGCHSNRSILASSCHKHAATGQPGSEVVTPGPGPRGSVAAPVGPRPHGASAGRARVPALWCGMRARRSVARPGSGQVVGMGTGSQG